MRAVRENQNMKFTEWMTTQWAETHYKEQIQMKVLCRFITMSDPFFTLSYIFHTLYGHLETEGSLQERPPVAVVEKAIFLCCCSRMLWAGGLEDASPQTSETCSTHCRS